MTCEDGKIYNNPCLAACAGQTQCDGESCGCSKRLDPVLCDNGTLYDNRCLAACDGQTRCLGTFPQCRDDDAAGRLKSR